MKQLSRFAFADRSRRRQSATSFGVLNTLHEAEASAAHAGALSANRSKPHAMPPELLRRRNPMLCAVNPSRAASPQDQVCGGRATPTICRQATIC